MNNKVRKIIKWVIRICIIIILLELIIMLYIKVDRERKLERVSSISDFVMINNNYLTVGESDFSDSDNIEEKRYEKDGKSIIATQARIALYDKDMNLLKEGTYPSKYDSSFYSVLNVDDGYIAVGSFIKNEKKLADNAREGLIVKFDKDFKIVWETKYDVLGDTEFYKIIDDGDNNYIVVGKSIYVNMEVGNHTTGGGVILRIDKDGNITSHNNYGRNKTGMFTDIIKVNDGYIVCGRDGNNYGILVKFKKDFERVESDTDEISKKVMWQRVYSNTDKVGFTSMVNVGDTIYVVGALNVSDKRDDKDNIIYEYDAGIVKYNLSGKYLGKYNTKESVHNRFNSITSDGKYLYLTMLGNVDDKNKIKSYLLKYDLDLNLISKEEYTKNDINNYLSSIKNIDDTLIVSGSSNDKCSFLKGCDYQPIIKTYNKELKVK